MNAQMNFLTAFCAIVCLNTYALQEVSAEDILRDMDTEDAIDETVTRGTRKFDCLRVGTLRVCDNITIDGTFVLTSATGAVGIPGLGGALAYGQIVNSGTVAAVAPGAAIPFNAAVAPAVGVIPVANGITGSLTALSTGLYQINYYAAGTSSASIVIALYVNGTEVASSSTQASSSGAINGVSGSVLIELNAGDIVQLYNDGTAALTLTTGTTSTGALISNARLAAMRIA